MAKNDRTTAGPYWTRNWIEKMWRFTAENFVDFDTGAVDFEALGREEYEFRKALFYRKFKNSERAREAFVESEDLYKVNVERGKKGGRPKKNPQPEENAEPDAEQPKAQTRTTEKATAAPAAPAPAPKAAVKKPGQIVWGTFANVYLSQDEYNEILHIVGNLNSMREMVDSFSAKLEDGSVTSANHYATLTNWANYRKSHAEGEGEEGGRRYETVSEHNMRVSRQADVWIAEHFGKNKKEAVNG